MSEITYSNDEMRRAFKNRTFEGRNHTGSLNLAELPDGTYALLAYDWGKIADVSPDGEIRVFAGWAEWAQDRFTEECRSGGEATTKRHVRELVEYLLGCGRSFEMRDTRPTVGTPPESLRELGHLDMIPSRGEGLHGKPTSATEKATAEGRTE